MNKIKNIMDEYGLSEHQVTRFTGQPSRSNTLRTVASGKRDITSINLNLLTSYARGLGLKLEDLLNNYDLDGSTTQVNSIKRYVDKFKRFNKDIKEFNNNGYIISVGIDKKDYKLKNNYEFLNPQLQHEFQPTNEIYLLNNAYLPVMKNKELNVNTTLAKLTPKFNKYIKSVLIYSPLEQGGDLKLIANVYDKTGYYMFSEIVGCEWIDTEDNQTICYYKAHSQKPFTPDEISKVKKQEISELEFFKAFNTQFRKYNVLEM